MLSEDEQIQALSDDLARTWGPKLAMAIHPLNLLIGEALSKGDLLAFGFISQVLAKIMMESCELAKGIQAEQRGHVPGPQVLQ